MYDDNLAALESIAAKTPEEISESIMKYLDKNVFLFSQQEVGDENSPLTIADLISDGEVDAKKLCYKCLGKYDENVLNYVEQLTLHHMQESESQEEYYCPDLASQGNTFGTFQGMPWS